MRSTSDKGANILVAGVAGHNRGDDAIAHALVARLRSRFEVSAITATVLRPGVFRDGSVREVVVNRKNPLSHARLACAVWDSSLVVIGGGSIIQDEFHTTLLRGIMAFYVELALLARRCSRPMVTAPIGVDTLRSEQGRRMARLILQQCALVTVRDARSAENARALLGPNARVVLGADPAFCLEHASHHTPSEPPCLVLAPAFEATTSEQLPRLLAELIEHFLSRHPSGCCRILAMDERSEEDGGRSQAILHHVAARHRAAVAITVPRTVDEVVALLQRAAALVTMRLHPMILGAGVTPTLCLSRGLKTDSIAQELSVPLISLRSEAWSGIPEQFARFMDELASNEARQRSLEAPAAGVVRQRARMEAYLDALAALLPERPGFARAPEGALPLLRRSS